MSRIADTGNYEINNVIIQTVEKNNIDKGHLTPKKARRFVPFKKTKSGCNRSKAIRYD